MLARFARSLTTTLRTGTSRLAVSRVSSSSAASFAPVRQASTEIVATDDAPAAIGPYSQAVKANGFVFVSGCLGLDPKTGEFPSEEDVVIQTHQVMKNMNAVLKEANSSFEQVVKTTVLLASMDDYATVNEIYARFFSGENPPARAAFAVKTLPKNALVEIECVAVHD